MSKPPPGRRLDDMTADEVKQFWHGFCERKNIDPAIRTRGAGSVTTNTGTPQSRADSRPAGSVSTATAPAATASGQNSAPWWLPPGSAAYRSPGRTARESWVMPVTAAALSVFSEGSGFSAPS